MDIPIHAPVQCADGPHGHVDRIIVDPTTQKITHVVVREGGIMGEAFMIPADDITESAPGFVRTHLLRKQLEAMPVFVDKRYRTMAPLLSTGFVLYPIGGVMYWPFYPINAKDFVMIESTIPKGELALSQHDKVEATDGQVGVIDEFLVDPRDDAITHLVLREGHLWGQKYVTIPVSQIAHIVEGSVRLKLTKQQIAALPALHKD